MTFDDVIVVEITIVTSHLQRGVSHDVLKGECIAAAVHQILASKSVPERMDGSPLHTSAVVVLYDGEPQSVLCQKIPKFITEQIIRRSTTTNCHVIPQNANHCRTEGDNLNFAILRVPKNDLLSAQVYILILNVAYCSSPTATIQQEIDDNPIAILAELTIGFRLLQKRHEFIIGVGLLFWY